MVYRNRNAEVQAVLRQHPEFVAPAHLIDFDYALHVSDEIEHHATKAWNIICLMPQ